MWRSEQDVKVFKRELLARMATYTPPEIQPEVENGIHGILGLYDSLTEVSGRLRMSAWHTFNQGYREIVGRMAGYVSPHHHCTLADDLNDIFIFYGNEFGGAVMTRCALRDGTLAATA